jgi:hypothetical protein
LFQLEINKVAAVLLEHKRISGTALIKLIKKDNMRNTKAISNPKKIKKQAERRAQANVIKQNRAQKVAVPALKAARVAVENVKRQASATENLTKLQKQAANVKRQAMYVKPGFITLTKKEIAELSEADRTIYMAQKSKEDRKNDKKSETAKATRAPARKRTVRRELTRAITKAQRIVDGASAKPTVAKVTKETKVTVSEKKHSHKREIERRTRQASKKTAKSNQ